MLSLLCIVFVAFTGLTKGAGVLPDGPLNAAVGGKVRFNPTLTAPETPVTSVSWKSADRDIITFNVVNVTAPEYEGRITLFISTGSLELRNLTLNDSGEYRVNIQQQGEFPEEGSTRLDVYEPVSNVTVTHSSTDLVEFNGSSSLSCSASGSSLSFQWLHDTSVVAPSDRFQLTDGNTTLTIVNVTRSDHGNYMCHVSNPASSGTSDPVTLSVSYGPGDVIFLHFPSQESFEEGSEITMSCSAVSRPSALFYWLLNGSRLPHTGEAITFKISESGNYSCQACNEKTLRCRTSSPLALTVLEPSNPSGCSAGCIAGIVIACLVVIGAAGGGVGFYIYKKKKKQPMTSSNSNTATTRASDGQINTGYSANQELNDPDDAMTTTTTIKQ